MILRTEVGTAWRAGRAYVARGFALTRRQRKLHLELVVFYSVPALVAAWLVLYAPADQYWHVPLTFTLPWLTVAVAPIVVMLAAHAASQGESVGVVEVSRRGLRWFPRYFWTNVHTTAVFWVPVGGLTLVREHAPIPSLAPPLAWVALIGVVAVHQHVRTLLAPYLAVHSDLSGTRAALMSWRLGGLYFWPLLGAFVAGVAPVGAPLAVAYLLALALAPPRILADLATVSPQVIWVAFQAIRPILIPALYTLYVDIWAECEEATEIGKVPAEGRESENAGRGARI